MGSTTVGTVTKDVPLTPVVIKNVLSTNASTTSTNTTLTRHLIQKGTYTVTTQPMGFAVGGSSLASVDFSIAVGTEFTILTQYADNGRPGPVLIGDNNNPKANLLILQRDAYVQATIKNNNGSAAINNISYDITFTPTYSPFKSLGTVTGNRTSTGDSASSDSSSVNFNCAQIGWDYDRNAPLLITTNAYVTYQRTRASDFYLWRYNADGTWGYTFWSGIATNAGSSWYDGSGLGFRGNQNNCRQSSFFIKNGYLHNLDMSGLMTDVNGLRWGWIKGDISSGTTSGTTLTMSPGHTNQDFATASSSISGSNDNIMIYYHDKVNNKVIFNGARSNTYSGAWANYGWIHYWSQWDIATNTVEYSQYNGVVDPRIAGSSAGTNLAWDMVVPNGSTGFSYAVGDNGGYGYLAKWNRDGNYVGVGTVQSKRAYMGQTTIGAYSGTSYTNYNTISYLPNGVMVYGSNMYNSCLDYLNGSINQPQGTYDNYSLFSGAFWGLNANLGSTGSKTILLVVDNTIVIAEMAYVKANGSGDVRRYVPITIYTAPVTASNLGSVTPGMGGIGSTAYGNPGINNGA